MSVLTVETLNAKVDRFDEIFQHDLRTIEALSAPDNARLVRVRKSLYVMVLDSLSRTVYPRRGNRQRFIEFLKRFADWPEGGRLSLPHLSRLLERAPEPEFEQLRAYVIEQSGGWVAGDVVSLGRDPDQGTIDRLWPKQAGAYLQIDGISKEDLTHYRLLYTYRNFLVHETRRPGYDFDFKGDSEPSYLHMQAEESPKEEIWVLGYPLLFFETLCKRSLKNLIGYLKQNGIDPFAQFKFGEFWIEDLNG